MDGAARNPAQLERTMSTRTVKVTPEPRPYFTTITKCDLCGLETPPGEYWHAQGAYTRPETAIFCKTGDVYPEEDCRTTLRLDVCPECFETKFIPAVENSLGVTFHEEED